MFTSVALLEMELLAAALIGAMWASNTLVAYPDVRAAGLVDNRAVRDAVSAGVVADLLSLLVLAVATSHAVIEGIEQLPDVLEQNASWAPSLSLWVTVPILVGFTMWLLPKIGRWFFIRVGRSRAQRFLFALVGMAAGASLAVAAGIEGLIGAFLAGLGLNRLVPKNSELMDRLDFVGSTIFIPSFLIAIGLSIDPAALFDSKTLVLGVIFAGLVIVGKTIATAISALMFGLSFNESGLMASLSFGQAASTLAIAQVGFGLGVFGQDVVNGAVLAVVLTALATSFGTQYFIRRVPRPAPPPAAIGERVLVDVRPTSSNLDAVMEFAGLIAATDGGLVIPFTAPAPGQLDAARLRIVEAEASAAAASHDSEGVARVSETWTSGAIQLVEESDPSLVVLTNFGPRFRMHYVFGHEIDSFGELSPIPAVAAQITRPWERVVLVTGATDVEWHAEDAQLATAIARRLRRRKDAPVLVLAGDSVLAEEGIGSKENVEFVIGKRSAAELLDRLRPDDMVVVPAYVLQDASLTNQLRVVRRLAQADVAIVAGPNRLRLAKNEASHRMERLIGPQQ